jgi:putative radical SAM enzyme (TIGR03279 family)
MKVEAECNSTSIFFVFQKGRVFNMAVQIAGVTPGSPAARAGVRAGDTLCSINGNPITDGLDYRFYSAEQSLRLALRRGEEELTLSLRKEEYDDLGLEFATYLIDRQHTCKNKCIFCFVDQMPGGLRETLYVKDDDDRMSFLFGNYITLTNLTQTDIDRIIKIRISPINVSVHTTNPALRVQMMKNPHAADSLDYLRQLTGAGIRVNTQLVLCPGVNDGAELERSLRELGTLYPGVQSVAMVPVGLTRYREGLYPLSP